MLSVLVLTTVAMVVFGVAGSVLLRRSLTAEVDERLERMAAPSVERERPPPDGTVTMVAQSLSGVDTTPALLTWVQVGAGTVVLLALAAGTVAIVRVQLRPLARMQRAADAIAGGDFAARVPEDGRHGSASETARLGAALNTMLGRLSEALREGEATAERMRRFVAEASHELRTPWRRSGGSRSCSSWGGSAVGSRPTRWRTTGCGGAGPGGGRAGPGGVGRGARGPGGRRPTAPATGAGQPDRQRAGAHTARNPGPGVGGGAGGPGPVGAVGGGVRVGALPSKVRGVAAVCVHDEGPGIRAQDRERLFDRFFRADGGRSRHTGGAGLGLAISAAVVSAHDGVLEVVSEPGEGTLFRVLLPLG
ncbi:ATP-binding protein [Nocardiopsis sp. FIRDI 009]|uniref:ATP-binding protein n=1 Tax=Nocardiopsis sp. FIRDI 009 TaxID=714197 RepID=UPI001E2F214B|nr:ATP-binding protein [Nocardiopsis sp. FIRDI 009]